jgi:DNA polymerase
MGLQREDVYIANILKARPPNNRTPQADEIARCAPYLLEQIRIVQPKVLVALGGPSAKTLLETDTGITRLRGTWAEFHDGVRAIPLMPTFHPAYLLRNYTRETRLEIWSDMKQVLERIGRAAPRKG